MNLFEYVGASPLRYVDPFGLWRGPWDPRDPRDDPFSPTPLPTPGPPRHPDMTCAEARRIVALKIAEWRRDGYDYAANLLQHFLNGGGTPYSPSPSDIAEIQQHAKGEICGMVAEKACELNKDGAIEIIHDGGSSNIRWWYIGSDKNMLYAFGGADLTLRGNVSFEDCCWKGNFQVELRDKYEFNKDGAVDELKQWASELWSGTYNAALFLEQQCGHKPFWNKANFPLSCDGCCD